MPDVTTCRCAFRDGGQPHAHAPASGGCPRVPVTDQPRPDAVAQSSPDAAWWATTSTARPTEAVTDPDRAAALEALADAMARRGVTLREVDLARFTADELLRLRVMVDEKAAALERER